MTTQFEFDSGNDVASGHTLAPVASAALFEAFREMILVHGRMMLHESDVLEMGATDIRALFFISEIGESSTPKQIADALGLSTGATTSLVDRLVEAGTIERSAHPTDRRSVLLHLTLSGHRAVKTVRDLYQSALATSVPAESADMVARVFHSLAQTLAGTIDRPEKS